MVTSRNKISDEFKGQGHRSKIIRSKMLIFMDRQNQLHLILLPLRIDSDLMQIGTGDQSLVACNNVLGSRGTVVKMNQD